MKIKNIKIITLACGILSSLLACTVIFGWYTHQQTLVQVYPSFAPMQFNTAIGFLLCGLLLIFLFLNKTNLSSFFATVAFSLGLATLLQYFLNVDFGIDNLFVDPVFITKTSHPGRMAPNTALCFTLCGLLAIGISRRVLMVGASLALVVLSTLSLLGYLTQYETLYGWGNLTRMAIHTAICFILIGLGAFSYAISTKQKNRFDFWQLLPPTISIVVAVLTIFSCYVIAEEAKARNASYFENLVNKTQNVLQERYTLYEESLRGGLGLFYASKSVERHEWKNYVKALALDEMLPGINGIGYINYVLEENLDSYLELSRLDNAPNFKNHPETEHADKFIIKFIEPIEKNLAAVGLDIGFEKRRREAAERARDLSVPVLTKKISLVQDQKKQAGFLLLIPIYETHDTPQNVEKRRMHIQGWVYAPFIAPNFFAGTNDINGEQLNFQVYDGREIKAENLIYENMSPEVDFYKFQNRKTKTIFQVAEQTWTIIWRTNAKYSPPSNENLGTIILIFGLGFSLFLYFTLSRLLHNKQIISDEVERRTKKLQETEVSLRQANEELEEFSYRTSHDLRSPLVSAIGLLTVVESAIKEKDKETALESVRHIRNSLNKLEVLVKDILALTKAKSVEENTQKVSLEKIVNDALLKFSNLDNFERLSITKSFEYPNDLLTQKSRLILIVENLISNAIKYQDVNKPESFIKISTYKKDTEFVFEVEDNGLGIPEDKQEKLFTMFKRFHSRVSFGSGLGLYMMKKSALVLGGDVSFEDNGHSTIFKFKIQEEKI